MRHSFDVSHSHIPMTEMQFGLVIPLGNKWKSNSVPSTTTVWPALLPPYNLEWTGEKCKKNISVKRLQFHVKVNEYRKEMHRLIRSPIDIQLGSEQNYRDPMPNILIFFRLEPARRIFFHVTMSNSITHRRQCVFCLDFLSIHLHSISHTDRDCSLLVKQSTLSALFSQWPINFHAVNFQRLPIS